MTIKEAIQIIEEAEVLDKAAYLPHNAEALELAVMALKKYENDLEIKDKSDE